MTELETPPIDLPLPWGSGPRRTSRVGLAHVRQLVQFGLVGSSGFVVNLGVYTVCLKAFGLHYLASACIAFCFAVANNFVLNRLWTFREDRDTRHVSAHAARFLLVSASALVPNLLILHLLVEAGLDKVAGQVIAVCVVIPISFAGNKLWTFR
jgi:putative flippase GtrA